MARVDTAQAAVERREEIGRLYEKEAARMWHAIRAFAGDTEIANDAVAETFAQALRRGVAIRDPARWAWRTAFVIARGLMVDRPVDSAPGTDEAYELDDSARELFAALRHLSTKQRAAVVLHHAAGYPIKDVAAIVGSTPSAVKVHLHRGRNRLRQLLEPTDE